MQICAKTDFSMAAFVLMAAAVTWALPARADITPTPMCSDVVTDPTIVSCTCICDNTSFAACQGQQTGVEVPTPSQCPDVNGGRRVLSRGDALAIADPHEHSNTQENVNVLLYQTENDTNNAGLGIPISEPVLENQTAVPCSGHEDEPFPHQTRFARLFNLPYDMLVTLRPTTNADDLSPSCSRAAAGDHNFVLDVISAESGGAEVPQLAFFHGEQWVQLAIDDFNFDGFDDIFFINISSITIYTAKDTSDPTQGLSQKGGASTTLPSGAFQAPINEPTTGDFNGDGIVDVAWIGGDFPNKEGSLSVFFASICPADIAGTMCEGASPFEVILDPASVQFGGAATSTIQLDDAPLTPTNCGVVQSPGTPTVTPTDVLRPGAVVLGNFEDNGLGPQGAPVDELVVTYISGSTKCFTDLQYWTFAQPSNSGGVNGDSWALQRGDTIENLLPQATETGIEYGLDIPPVLTLYARSAYLDWYGLTEQAVIAVNGMQWEAEPYQRYYNGYLAVIGVSVDGAGDQATAQACTTFNGLGESPPFLWGLDVGRFSTSTIVNPDNPEACSDFPDAEPGDCPYNLQITLLTGRDGQNAEGGPWDNTFRQYTVKQSQPGTTSSLECDNDNTVNGFLPVNYKSTPVQGGFQQMHVSLLRGGSRLRAGDAFGGSVRVGTPWVAHLSAHTQTQTVIQAPPSLIDYVQPDSTSAPAIINFTRAPNNYWAQVDFKTTSSETATSQSRYSYSSSTTETVAGELKFKTALLGSIDIKNTESWGQYSDNYHNEQLGTYSVLKQETGARIGVDDQVWWTQDLQNMYYYPVIGETACPASLTCDPSDTNTTGCTVAASNVSLTCSVSGDGCDCLSQDASASLCPTIPSDVDTRSCAEQDSDVCCSLLPQQLNVNYSGPSQTTRSSAPGASLEWYQPKHEPAQILSYPSSTTLIEQRQQSEQSELQELGLLTEFATGTNETSETISWTCGTSSNVSAGSGTVNSFDSDSSITVGMNNIVVVEEGINITAGFDYQNSTSNSSSLTQTVAQTSSEGVEINFAGAGFYNVGQYAYTVAGLVMGTQRPAAVLDNPDIKVCPSSNVDCDTADQVQTDCTTTGPITVAFTADPEGSGSGIWWESSAPYQESIDVALNNPSRWLRTSQVADPTLQCRGPANVPVCYTTNQPGGATATEVWDSLFYNMKGLIVTNGAATGPLRDTAAVGDEIFLQARVYNYSLKTMDAGTVVYARIYRQQLDVNNTNENFAVVDYATDADGQPLPAVPIGPEGLGDSSPIKVISAQNDSGTIPPFNLTTDPANDNIGIAATSFIVEEGDECEYDQGIQNCDGAYYAYWVSVWAENPDSSVATELTGHGLKTQGTGSFNPATTYSFITEVPLEMVSFNNTENTFSNNAAMYKKVFSILPEGSTDVSSTDTRVEVVLDNPNVTPENPILGDQIVVSAQVTSWGAATRGATVVFSEDDPAFDGTVFDAEWLPHIRADDSHFVRVNYNPLSCGPHAIYAQLTGGVRALGAEQIALVDVGIDYDSMIDYMIDQVMGLELEFPGNAGSAHKNNLVRELNRADSALDKDQVNKGVFRLGKFNDALERLKQKNRIDSDEADFLIAKSDEIAGCVQ